MMEMLGGGGPVWRSRLLEVFSGKTYLVLCPFPLDSACFLSAVKVNRSVSSCPSAIMYCLTIGPET
jgi:hypothetical protein